MEIQEELNSSEGKAIKEYLLTKLEELNSIDNIREYETDKAQSIELKAQKKAYLKLKEIISELEGMETLRNETRNNEYSVRD